MDDCSSFFSVLGGSILTSRSLSYGTGFQEYTGDRSAPAYTDECELFLPVTEKVSVETRVQEVLPHKLLAHVYYMPQPRASLP